MASRLRWRRAARWAFLSATLDAGWVGWVGWVGSAGSGDGPGVDAEAAGPPGTPGDPGPWVTEPEGPSTGEGGIGSDGVESGGIPDSFCVVRTIISP